MGKRIFLLLLIIIISANISSCGDKVEPIGIRPELENIETYEKAEKFDIYLVARNEINSLLIDKIAVEFKKLFDIDLSITPEYGIDTSGNKSMQQVKSTGADGLYLFPYASISRISDLAFSGDILPLDEYLMDNPIWNEMPASMRKMYESTDGHIWAIPRGFTPVLMGRVFRDDYLKELGLAVPDDLDSLYEVSKKLSQSDPDGNGLNDTFGMAYSNAYSFRDIFYANGVPINISNDGYQLTSISYNSVYGSYEDSMLMENMKLTLEYIAGLEEAGILRKLSGRYSSRTGDFLGNSSISNSYIRVPGYALTDERFSVSAGLRGSETINLNPMTYDFNDGFYLLGANTENPSMTINSFLNLIYGDLEGYLFASKGVPGETYTINSGTIEVLDKDFFSYGNEALLKSNPLFSYEVMDIVLNMELASGDIVANLIDISTARDIYIEKARGDEIIYDITMNMAYPEVFVTKPGEIVNSSAGAIFNSIFSQVVSGRVSIDDAINQYTRTMKTLGMQDIINELNREIDAVTRFKYQGNN